VSSTSLEIVTGSVRFENPERVPVIPLIGLYSLNISGMSALDLLHDGAKQAKSQLLAQSEFGYDGVFTIMDLTVEAEVLGAGVEFPRRAFPFVRDHPLADPEKYDELPPLSVEGSRLAVFVDATTRMAHEVGERVLVSSYIIGPFTLAGHLLGIENLMEITTEQPSLASDIVRDCSSVLEPYLDALIEAGARNIVILEPSASNSMISPRFFERFSQPNVETLVSRCHSADALATLHICGRASRIIQMMANTKADVLSIDSAVSLRQAKLDLEGKAALMGNVDTSLMINGTAEAVARASQDCLKEMEDSSGFILSTSCDVPLETPRDNITSLVSTILSAA
jgi:uroporphyrinogen decarboxylase